MSVKRIPSTTADVTTAALAAKADKANGTLTGATKLGLRDTSAAHDQVLASTSSVALTAERTTTFDAKNTSNTLDVPALAAVGVAYSNGATSTFGEDKTTWDTPALACDTKGGLQLIINGFTSDNTRHNITLRINGAETDIERAQIVGGINDAHTFDGSTSGSPTALLSANVSNGVINSAWQIIITAPNVSSANNSPARLLHVVTVARYNPTGGAAGIAFNQGYYFYKGVGEIQTIGVADSVASGMTSASNYSIKRT